MLTSNNHELLPAIKEYLLYKINKLIIKKYDL